MLIKILIKYNKELHPDKNINLKKQDYKLIKILIKYKKELPPDKNIN